MISKQQMMQAWRQRHRHLSDTQDQLRREAFRLIRTGTVATDSLLSERAGLPVKMVREEIMELDQQGLIVRNRDGVAGVYGLSLVATPYHLSLDRHSLFTWCALDAVGIAAGLMADAGVRAQCFYCQQELSIDFCAGQVSDVSTAHLSIWLTPPGQGKSAVADT